jgi:hypothetical protein
MIITLNVTSMLCIQLPFKHQTAHLNLFASLTSQGTPSRH